MPNVNMQKLVSPFLDLDRDEQRQALEAILFASDEPLSTANLYRLLVEPDADVQAIEEEDAIENVGLESVGEKTAPEVVEPEDESSVASEDVEPETAEPEAGAVEPESAEPETAEPEAGAVEPESAEPETAEPEAVESAATGVESETAETAPEGVEPEDESPTADADGEVEADESGNTDAQPKDTSSAQAAKITSEAPVSKNKHIEGDPAGVLSKLQKQQDTLKKLHREKRREIRGLFDELIEEINQDLDQSSRPFHVVRIAGGYQFATRPEHGEMVARLLRVRAKRRMSRAAVESLAIIAYRQPLTKSDVEAIRGVNSGEVVKKLMEKGLVSIVGRSDSVGKPLLYGTTKEFLKTFGLHDLTDLPRPRELKEILRDSQDEMSQYQTIIIDDDDNIEVIEERIQALSGQPALVDGQYINPDGAPVEPDDDIDAEDGATADESEDAEDGALAEESEGGDGATVDESEDGDGALAEESEDAEDGALADESEDGTTVEESEDAEDGATVEESEDGDGALAEESEDGDGATAEESEDLASVDDDKPQIRFMKRRS